MLFSLIYGRLLQKWVVLQGTANPVIAQLSSLSELQTSLLFFSPLRRKQEVKKGWLSPAGAQKQSEHWYCSFQFWKEAFLLITMAKGPELFCVFALFAHPCSCWGLAATCELPVQWCSSVSSSDFSGGRISVPVAPQTCTGAIEHATSSLKSSH